MHPPLSAPQCSLASELLGVPRTQALDPADTSPVLLETFARCTSFDWEAGRSNGLALPLSTACMCTQLEMQECWHTLSPAASQLTF